MPWDILNNRKTTNVDSIKTILIFRGKGRNMGTTIISAKEEMYEAAESPAVAMIIAEPM